MAARRTRRDVLGALLGAGCVALTGCSSSLQRAPPGTLVVRNDDDRAHAVSLFVTTMASTTPGADRLYCTGESTTPPPPYGGTAWQYELRYDVGAGETVREDEVFPYAGDGYHVTFELDDTDCETRGGYEIDYHPDDGFVLEVTINESGHVRVDAAGDAPA